ncbi:MAG: PilN domain-containing protein [Actinomycetota bacterium]
MRPINLLPPEVAEERARRRRVGLLVVAGVAYALLLVAGIFYWNTRVSAARADVEMQEEINSDLEREVASLADAGALQAKLLAKTAFVQEALVNDIDWGIFLNDLARLLPERVWVESFNGSIVAGESVEIVGQVSFSGVGFDFPDVSEWLRSLGSGGFAGITGPWVSSASESTIGEEAVISFVSTAVLTTGAVTDRAQELIPEVP